MPIESRPAIPDAPPGVPTSEPSDIPVDVNRLIIGRAIRFPVHNKSGALLLPSGAVITAEFKRRLTSQHVAVVCVHPDDLETIAFQPNTPEAVHADALQRPLNFDNEITRKLDEALTEGLPFVTNQGPAVRRSVVYHGMKAFDIETRTALQKSHRQSVDLLGSLMRTSTVGGEIHGEAISSTIDTFLAHLTADIDQTVGTPLSEGIDDALARHCLQMSILGMAIGIELGLNSENVARVGVAGLVHDWGMLRVPHEIRNAPRALTPAEILEVRKHPIYSLEMLERIDGLPILVPMTSYQVHEKIDGTGYPRGRVERNIHLFARILHVADVFVALTSPRPHRPAYSHYAAMCSLLSGDNAHGCDPLIIRALLRVKSLFPVGSFVTLSDSSVAQVLRANGDQYTEPIVQLVQDSKGRPVRNASDPPLLDLSKSPLRVTEALPTPGRNEVTSAPGFVRRTDSPAVGHSLPRAPHLPLSPAAMSIAGRAGARKEGRHPHLTDRRGRSAPRRTILRGDATP